MPPKLETSTVGGAISRASVAPAHTQEHHRTHVAAAVGVLAGIIIAAVVGALAGMNAVNADILGAASQIAATIAALASIAAALYYYLFLGSITRRKSDVDKTFSSEIGPWLDEARRKYANEKLSGGDTGKGA